MKRVALIGLGAQCQNELLPALLSLGELAQVVAICDINHKFLDGVIHLLPYPGEIRIFKDYRDLFTEVKNGTFDLDCAVVSVPHFLYGDIVDQAIEAGVQVFKEKPFAHDLAEAKKISHKALKENVQVYTVTKRQFYDSYAKGLELMRGGEIGTPYMYNARHFIPHGNLYEGWRSTIDASGGGVLMDMGYHLLDVILRYFGDVSQANLHWSNVAKPDYSYEVEDAASLHNWHPSGVHGVFQLAALSGPKEESLEIRGTKGRMMVTKDALVVFDVDGKQTKSLKFSADGTSATAKAMRQFFQNKKSIWSQNLSLNMRLMRVIDMAYQRRFS